jgi:hypothetical protein
MDPELRYALVRGLRYVQWLGSAWVPFIFLVTIFSEELSWFAEPFGTFAVFVLASLPGAALAGAAYFLARWLRS